MLHLSTGIHHRTDPGHKGSHHAGFPARAITLVVAEVIRDHWVSVGAVAFALWVVTDLGTNVVLVAPLLAVLAAIVNVVLNPDDAEDLSTTDAVEDRV